MKDFLAIQAAAWTQYLDRFGVHGSETYSGWGSKMEATVEVREWLPEVIKRHGIKTMLDAPCGDFNWMQHVDLGGVDYTGYDVEPYIVAANVERFPDRKFAVANLLTVTLLPAVDLILCRDFFFHLPNFYITRVLNKFRESGSRYLIATNHPGVSNDRDCPLDGGHEHIPGYYCLEVDLEVEPFCMSGRIDAVGEDRGAPQELVLFRL